MPFNKGGLGLRKVTIVNDSFLLSCYGDGIKRKVNGVIFGKIYTI